MPASRDRSLNAQRTPFAAGLLGVAVGAGVLLGIGAIGARPQPATALASAPAQTDDRPRGLISAADQRKQIIDRLDRVLDALERIDERLAHAQQERPAGRGR